MGIICHEGNRQCLCKVLFLIVDLNTKKSLIFHKQNLKVNYAELLNLKNKIPEIARC